ncbi:spermatogenesis [Mactra antiquata]
MIDIIQDNDVFPVEQIQNLQVLEAENTQLHSEVKKLRAEVSVLKTNKTSNEQSNDKIEQNSAMEVKIYTDVNKQSDSKVLQEIEDFRKENTALHTENSLLSEELEALRDTYNKLVIAGDNLQEMYDQLVLEKEQTLEEMEKIATGKQELAKENEYLLADANAMHDDIERLVHEVEKLHDQNQSVLKEKEELERKHASANHSGKASEFARVVEERDKLYERVLDLEKECEEFKQNHDIVLEEVQSLQTSCQRAEYERDQIQQEFDSLQDEFENIQGSQEGLQLDYTQLEQDYSDLLADKEKLEQEFLEVQTASVSVENHNPAMTEEREKLQQENEVLAMEKEQLEMTIKELSKSNALLQEELSTLQKAVETNKMENGNKVDETPEKKKEVGKTDGVVQQNNKDGVDKASVDAMVEKDRRIRSLQIQISRLQQQLAESDRHYREVINRYRTHLISAVQGHMDPDVQQALYNVIELRSKEQFC